MDRETDVAKKPVNSPALLADIGGTNARFALLQNGVVGPVVRLKTSDFEGPAEAIAAFLDQASIASRPRRAVLAVAGPVGGESACLTNGTWRFEGGELRAALALDTLKLVNDFAALAMALPHLPDNELVPIGSGEADDHAPRLVMGPGTGLGVAALLSHRDELIVMASEGGHAALAARSEREWDILGAFRNDAGHIAVEDMLSGPGLVRLYNIIAAREGKAVAARREQEITDAALSGDCDTSRAALDLFCTFLGRYAGDLALVFGARGGVYLAGGIVPSLSGYLEQSGFRACFEDKGVISDYLRRIPVHVVTRPDPAFLGLTYLAKED